MEETVLTCKNCSETFSTFLKEMAGHNLKVTCPKCHQTHDYAPHEVKPKAAD
jgi:hypothetical protein